MLDFAIGLATISRVNAAVRYKSANICETTAGVNSYSGYVDLDDHSHLFFWFFEARQSPETAPITLWLNGGPGTDSLLGLFTGNVSSQSLSVAVSVPPGPVTAVDLGLTLAEVGPCTVNPDLTTSLDPFSWSEKSNLLSLSQPVGVGFSYGPNAAAIDTSELAAESAWLAVQAVISELPRMSPKIGSRDFNIWTERCIFTSEIIPGQ